MKTARRLAAALLALPLLAAPSHGRVFHETLAGGWAVRGEEMRDGVLSCSMTRGEGGDARTLIIALRVEPPALAFVALAPSSLPPSLTSSTFEERPDGRLGPALTTRVENGVVAVELELETLAALRAARDSGRPGIVLRVVSHAGPTQRLDIPVEGVAEAMNEQRRCLAAGVSARP